MTGNCALKTLPGGLPWAALVATLLTMAGCIPNVAEESISTHGTTGTNGPAPETCILLPCPVRGQWAWAAGPSTDGDPGAYGSAPFRPSARYYLAAASSATNQAFVFGGFGPDSVGTQDYLNDLWTWDGTAWAWVS